MLGLTSYSGVERSVLNTKRRVLGLILYSGVERSVLKY